LRDEEFEFLKYKRLEFLKGVGYFSKAPSTGRKGSKKEALRGSTIEDSYECIRILSGGEVITPSVMSQPTFWLHAIHCSGVGEELLNTSVISKIWRIMQKDNGSEFIGNVRKKTNRPSAFQKKLQANQIEPGRIPPPCSYLQRDVEAFHRLVEDELYEIESYDNSIQF